MDLGLATFDIDDGWWWSRHPRVLCSLSVMTTEPMRIRSVGECKQESSSSGGVCRVWSL